MQTAACRQVRTNRAVSRAIVLYAVASALYFLVHGPTKSSAAAPILYSLQQSHERLMLPYVAGRRGFRRDAAVQRLLFHLQDGHGDVRKRYDG